MAKAELDQIDQETYLKVKQMSIEEMNIFLYSLYLNGYTQGQSDMIRNALGSALKEDADG